MSKTKAEREAEKLARKENRDAIILALATLKSKDINKMTTKEKDLLLQIISDYLGISLQGRIQ